MKNLSSFNKFINESYLAGSRAPLYHVTNKGRASLILREDSLKNSSEAKPQHSYPPSWVDKNKPGVFKGISLTRDKNFKLEGRPVTFIFDSEKLMSKYDIRPYDYFRTGFKKADPRRKTDKEYEEVLWASVVPDLHKYLIGIQVDVDYEDEDAGPNDMTFGDNDKFFWDTLSEYSNKYRIGVTDQHGKTLNLFEGIYSDLLGGTRMIVSKAADSPDDVDLYYSTYNPGTEDKTLANKFMDHLKKHNIKYTKTGKNRLRLTNDELAKMKKSLYNLPNKS